MSTVHKFVLYGPTDPLKRLPARLMKDVTPKFHFTYDSPETQDKVYVLVYEEYEKMTNSTVTLTCVAEYTPKKARVHLKKTGGRMGFRGAALREEKNIEATVVDFIMDYTSRFGLTIQNDPTGFTEDPDR